MYLARREVNPGQALIQTNHRDEAVDELRVHFPRNIEWHVHEQQELTPLQFLLYKFCRRNGEKFAYRRIVHVSVDI